MFTQTELIEGCNQAFPRSTNWALGMHVETRRDHKKQRELYNITDHLSDPPSSTSDSDVLGVGKNETSSGGCRLISSAKSSDAFCAVFAINAISCWQNQVDALDAINSVHPLVNLKEISFIDLHYVQIIHTTLDYHKIPLELNFTATKYNLSCLFTKFPRGSCYVQINVNANVEQVYHVIAVHVKNIGLKICHPLPQ